MKRLALLFLIALAAGFVAYSLTRQLAGPAPIGDELAWLNQEFRLTAAQSEAIERLHADYQPVCAAHCAAIYDAQTRLVAAERDHGRDSAAHRAASAAFDELVVVCQTATLRHLQAVAAVMPPAEGERYLKLVAPNVTQHKHTQPFGLR